MAMRKSIDEVLKGLPSELLIILERIGTYQPHPRLPPDWFQWQIAERHMILKHAKIASGANVLEIGCGPQAIATIPLASFVGENGRVVALDRGRWGDFWKLIGKSGVKSRVIPLQDDARKLPFPYSCFDLPVCIHGIRSFESRKACVEAIGEMLRVSKERIFISESSPIARNMAQKAHLVMYNLRRTVFLATGHPEAGDIPYFSQNDLVKIVKEAGAMKIDAKLIEVNMPHHLAWFPPEIFDKIEDKTKRQNLRREYVKGEKMLDKYGEEHPPVITINAWKKKSRV
ncbi:class I SAM-dependent methyltransferase [Candidatus Bathyarchaeota archaeon]|nr:MAG: class I SAM-dependent methyltransferase [Candidatus Bathyarchaeota archaeon]